MESQLPPLEGAGRSAAKNMAVHRHFQIVLVVVGVLHVVGCRSLSSTSDRKVVNSFAQIDTLIIARKPEPIVITDTAAIEQLRQLFEQARWRPFIDTMPADVVAIKCMRDGVESFRLLFGAGWLIEWVQEKGATRRCVLDKESCNWLDKLSGQAK